MTDSSFTFQHPVKSICSNDLQCRPSTITPSGLNQTQSRKVSDFNSWQAVANTCTVVLDTLKQFVKSKLCKRTLFLKTGETRLSLSQSLELRKFTCTKLVLWSVRIWNASAVTFPPILAILSCLALLKYSWTIWWNVLHTLRRWNSVWTGSNVKIYWNTTSVHGKSNTVTVCSWQALSLKIHVY